MIFIRFLIVFLIATTVLFAQNNKKNINDYLGFAESDNNFAVGILADWDSKGFGFPFVYDHGAFNGMFSFGGELRMRWTKYTPNWYNYYFNSGYWYGVDWIANGQDAYGWYNDYGYKNLSGVNVPVYRQYANGYRVSINPDYTLGEAYNPYSLNKKYRKFILSPKFRFMFHPFGIPAFKGQIKIANVLDPYIGWKFGFSIVSYDNDDPFHQGVSHRYVDFPVVTWFTAGIRWYFRENIALWSEFSEYDFSFGVNFAF